VREIFEIVDAPPLSSPQEEDGRGKGGQGTGEGKIVLIGRGLERIPRLTGMEAGL